MVERNRRGLRTGLYLVLALYPLFGLLDRTIAPPEAWGPLLVSRGVVIAAALAGLLLTYAPAWPRWATAATTVATWTSASGIAVMTAALGGLTLHYYAGISLVLAGAPLLFVWPDRVVVATHASVVVTYVAIDLAVTGFQPGPDSFSNVTFLTAMAVIVAVGQRHLYRRQREQFEQRVNLEQATASLERPTPSCRSSPSSSRASSPT